MTCGGWYSIHDLIKTMNSESMSEWRQKTHTPIYEEINDPNFDEKWTEVLESLKMKAKRRHTSYKMKF
jgi:hypothetical protein